VNLPTRARTILLIALVVLAAGAPAEAQRAMIKMATLVPQGSSWHTTLQEMAAKWQDASGGKIKVRLYPGGVAGDDGDVVRKMRLGTLDAGVLAIGGFTDIDRSIYGLCLPMMYDSYAELDAVTEKLEPELQRIYAEKGFVVLALTDAGWVHFFSTSPVRTPDDLRKLKMFSWAGDDQGIELYKAAGFKPVPLPSTEISTALQTGLVNAVPTTSRAAVLLQWYRHAPYMTNLRWAPLMGGVVLSKAAWNKVPEDLRPAFWAAAREAAEKLSASTRAGEADDVAAMEAHGLTVVEVDPAALAQWRSAAEAVYPTLRGSFVPAEIFDQAMRARDAARTEAKSSR
jgi:TRAP-type transport system periplasmic protein